MNPLSHQESLLARALWNAMMLAPSAQDLELARQQLREACPTVRLAVTEAIVRFWQQGFQGPPDYNPFDHNS